MYAGCLIRLADGREGRLVYNNLDGKGIKLDCPKLSKTLIKQLSHFEADEAWAPDILLREEWPGAWCECYGGDYEVVVEDD